MSLDMSMNRATSASLVLPPVHRENLLQRGTGAPSAVTDWEERGFYSLFFPVTTDTRLIHQEPADSEELALRKHSQSPRSAIMEIRFLTGLTWEKLAEIFDISRRSIHSWASGKPLNAKNEERVYRVLDAVHKIDRGTSRKNRALLLREHDGTGPIALLRQSQYEKFVELVGRGPGRKRSKLMPLSQKEKESRRPPPLDVMVSALQDSIHVERKKLISATPLYPKTRK